jgi:hypothetical protein
MRFTTDNSIYELDPARHSIRRLAGTNTPTPRQGDDGEWRRFHAISAVTIGCPVIIVWRMQGTIARATHTSPVTTVDEQIH